MLQYCTTCTVYTVLWQSTYNTAHIRLNCMKQVYMYYEKVHEHHYVMFFKLQNKLR